jgi:hypothetical protein
MKNLLLYFNKLISTKVFKSQKAEHIKRPIRIKIHNEQNVVFHIANEVLRVANISSSGIALDGKNCILKFKKKQTVSGFLMLEEEKIQMILEVVYVGKNIGCKIIKSQKDVDRKISAYFKNELMASRLYPLKSEILKPVPEGRPMAYVGEDNCELFFVEKEQELLKFSITILGNYFEIDKDHNLLHGSIGDDDNHPEGKIVPKKSDLVYLKEGKPNKELINTLEKFILNIENLSNEYKRQMIDLLKQPKE